MRNHYMVFFTGSVQRARFRQHGGRGQSCHCTRGGEGLKNGLLKLPAHNPAVSTRQSFRTCSAVKDQTIAAHSPAPAAVWLHQRSQDCRCILALQLLSETYREYHQPLAENTINPLTLFTLTSRQHLTQSIDQCSGAQRRLLVSPHRS